MATPITIPTAQKLAQEPPQASRQKGPYLFLRGFLDGAGIDSLDELDISREDLGYILGQCARIGTQEVMQMS